MSLQRFSAGETPWRLIMAMCRRQCPQGFAMTIRDPDEWRVIAEAWNQGIDSHLEAITERSQANAETGEVLVHPEELPVLCRRLWEADSDEAHELRSSILSSLGIEEV